MILAEPLVAHRPVESIDIRVLLRVSRLDELDVDAAVLSPIHRRVADVLGSIVAANH